MERLTVPDVRVDEHTTRRSIIDGNAVREHAMDIYWRLKDYEDTGYTPEEIAKLQGDLIQRNAELLEARQNMSETRYRVEYMDRDLKEACQKITNMKSRCVDMKNELCQYCGKYKHAHEGACDGCKWRDM